MTDCSCKHAMESQSQITLQFLAEVPLRRFQWDFHKGFDNVLKCKIHPRQNHNTWSEDCQQHIISATIDHHVARKFPPLLSYRKAFVKWILNKVWKCECNCQFQQPLNPYALHHQPASKEFVVMQESKSIISGGTTGLVSWKGGMLLAEWMLMNKELFSGTSLLELGSGCGFTGLVALKGTDVCKYMFTDCHQTVLSLLQKNVEINQISPEKYIVTKHVWGELDECKNFTPDCIVAADVVFDPDLVPDLVMSISCIANQSKRSAAFVALTERNPQTYECFLRELEAHKLTHEVLDTSHVPQIFYYDRSEDIHLLKIQAAPT